MRRLTTAVTVALLFAAGCSSSPPPTTVNGVQERFGAHGIDCHSLPSPWDQEHTDITYTIKPLDTFSCEASSGWVAVTRWTTANDRAQAATKMKPIVCATNSVTSVTAATGAWVEAGPFIVMPYKQDTTGQKLVAEFGKTLGAKPTKVAC